MYYIGIDWADKEHCVYITDDTAKKIASFRIPNSPDGVSTMLQKIDSITNDKSQAIFAIETSNCLLVDAVLTAGYTVYPINPKSVDRYRDRYRSSISKSDDFDAMVLANILRTDKHNHRPILPDSDLTREIRILARKHYKLIKLQTMLVNQITSCLKEYYPTALELFSQIHQNITLKFLKKFPTHYHAQKASLEQLYKFLSKNRYPNAKQKAQEIYQTFRNPQFNVEPFIASAQSEYLIALVKQLETLLPQIDRFEKRIQYLLNQHPDGKIFLSLPGADITLAARLLSEFGDNRQRYQNTSSVQSQAGTSPITIISGKQKFVRFRKSCRKFFRNTMHLFAFCSIKESIWAKQYYLHHINLGKKHSHALRCLANSWLEIIFSMWKKRTTYSEQIHLLKYYKELNYNNCSKNFVYQTS